MAAFPHFGASPGGLSTSVALIEEIRQDLTNRRLSSSHHGDSDIESQSLLSSRRSSVAYRRKSSTAASMRSRLGSRVGSHAHFDRNFLFTPYHEAGGAHEHAVVDDEASSIHLHNPSSPKPMSEVRLNARQSFSSAFNAVYGGAALSETTALLAPTDNGDPIFEAIPPPLAEPDENATIKELGILLRYSAPILVVTSVIIVGRVGTTELAAASLGSMTCNVLSFSVIQGFASALDALCPQAYASATPTLSSLYAQKTAFILVLLIVPQAILFWNAESIFQALRQDPVVSEKAALYLKTMSFALPSYAGFEVLRKWLQGQGRFFPATCIVCIVAPINVLLTYFLVLGPIDKIRFGFVGAPISTVISITLMFLLAAVYSIFFLPKDAWGGWSKKAFTGLGTNIKLGAAGTLMIGSEWWCWEIVGLATSYLGSRQLAAQSVLGVITSLFYQIPYAGSAAAAVRIANLIGAGHAKMARKSSRVALLLGAGIGCVEGLVLAIFRHSIGRLFTNDETVVALVATVLPIIALFQLADAVTGISSGLLRGSGRSTVGAAVNISSYYLIGLPLGFVLTFTHFNMGLSGLWLGLTASLVFTSTFMTYYITQRIDWQGEVMRAKAIFGADAQAPVSYGTH